MWPQPLGRAQAAAAAQAVGPQQVHYCCCTLYWGAAALSSKGRTPPHSSTGSSTPSGGRWQAASKGRPARSSRSGRAGSDQAVQPAALRDTAGALAAAAAASAAAAVAAACKRDLLRPRWPRPLQRRRQPWPRRRPPASPALRPVTRRLPRASATGGRSLARWTARGDASKSTCWCCWSQVSR
jgi:hypothetical protein